MATRILILDDDAAEREHVEASLSAESCEVLAAATPAAALQALEQGPMDALLVDPRAVDPEALAPLVRRALALGGVPVVLIAAAPAAELARQALGCGAWDCLTKPLDPGALLLCVRRARERVRQRRNGRVAQRDLSRTAGEWPIVATSEAMIELLELMERVAAHKSTVLLAGERGTGKEILARAIHAQSPRRDRPFVAVGCGASPPEQLQDELFGDPVAGGSPPAGRALFCEADEGTLFLDCVEALAPPLQTRLLRFLQDEAVPSLGDSKPRPLDVRIIAATGCDLEAEVAAGRFREDLFYRLDVVRLDVPPLRERPRDIPLLFDHFLAHYRAALGKPGLTVADDALAHLCAYDWPGNVRELANAVERAVMLAPGDRISLRELPDALETPSGRGTPQSFSLKAARKSLEADLIRRALRASNGNRTHAARRLAISHRGLLYKIKEYGIRD